MHMHEAGKQEYSRQKNGMCRRRVDGDRVTGFMKPRWFRDEKRAGQVERTVSLGR